MVQVFKYVRSEEKGDESKEGMIIYIYTLIVSLFTSASLCYQSLSHLLS